MRLSNCLLVACLPGETVVLAAPAAVALLGAMEEKTLGGILRSLAVGGGLSSTYFSYECTDYYTAPDGGVGCRAFAQQALPLFLEGPVRQMKVVSGQARKRDIYRAVKASPLYDAKLKMYTLSESLEAMGPEVGRMKAFSPGWLENQSVFLHMSYKVPSPPPMRLK